jgi:acyl-CoA thioesterase-1
MIGRIVGSRLLFVAAGLIGWPLMAPLAPPAVAESLPQSSAPFQVATLSHVPSQLSRDCSIKSAAFEGRAPLRSMRRALRESRPIKVMAIGSSSIVGVGASSPVAGYTVRLERDLEGFLKGFDVDLIPRGMSGEEAESTASRIKTEVLENRPDLVVWQVGTNDAIARVGEERFSTCLRSTLDWLAKQRVDVVLVNPQYVDRLARDDYYRKIVEIIADVAREQRVLVVDRYQAMAELAHQNGNNTYLASDRFHLNDLGYRCMAEYSARAIVSGILQADAEPGTAAGQGALTGQPAPAAQAAAAR